MTFPIFVTAEGEGARRRTAATFQFNQRITNETPQPNENKRRRTVAELPIIAELSGAVTALITAWLEVRVLPGPPPKNFVFDFPSLFARIAKPVHSGLAVLFMLWSF